MLDLNGNAYKIIDTFEPFEADGAEWLLTIRETKETQNRYGTFEFRLSKDMDWTPDADWHIHAPMRDDPMFLGLPYGLRAFKNENRKRIDYAIKNGRSILHLHTDIKTMENTIKPIVDF